MSGINQEIQIPATIKSLSHVLEAEISSNLVYTLSPTAYVSQLSNGNYLLTVTDKNGTTTAEIISHQQTGPNVYISATEPQEAKTGDVWFVLQ